MQMKKALVSMLIAAATVGAAVTPVTSAAAADFQFNYGPQPVQYERGPAPHRGYVWVPGHREWRGNGHMWVNGHWIREHQGYAYQPNRWIERGRWDHARGRDSDRDGIPDRVDRDRDGDGVPNRFDRQPDNPYRR